LTGRSWMRTSLIGIWMMVAATLLVRCEGKEKPGAGAKQGLVSKTPELKKSPQEGFVAPQFSAQDLRGRSVAVDDFQGKVVLLNFWATWCPPCRREIPSLESLYQLRKDKGFEILAVNVDRTALSKVTSFVEQNRMTFPVLLNPQGDIGEKYWVRAIPTSFLLDKKGVIRWKVVGGREWSGSEVLEKIDQLLSE
jgi:thiol-disulfide isomerase/thioredoxin